MTMEAGKQERVPAIELEGFSFSYPDAAAPAVQVPLFALEEGAFALVTGATGSGKTTLLRCLKPELAPTGKLEGALRVLGEDPTHLDADASARTIGYVAQSPENQAVCSEVWHEIAFGLENLGTGADEMRRTVAEVAQFLGIAHWMHREAATLSGGQKQLLNIAGVLALKPQVILLDEPSAQLDPVASHALMHALFRINRELGVTVVIATHEPERCVNYANKRYLLDTSGLHELDCAANAEAHSTSIKPGQAAAASGSTTTRSAGEQKDEPPVVELQHVSFRYERDADEVFSDCSLSVAPKSIHALIGGNACGKSSALRLIAGTVKAQRGRVRNLHARNQALVSQDPKALFVCDSVAEELAEWQRACGYGHDAIEDMIGACGLAGLQALHPFDLSGGQQQMLALAKILLTQPALILLDEPTKGLDAHMLERTACLLKERVQKGATVIMATHDLAFASRTADAVTLLFDGQDACTQAASSFFAESTFLRPVENEFTRLWDAQKAEGL